MKWLASLKDGGTSTTFALSVPDGCTKPLRAPMASLAEHLSEALVTELVLTLDSILKSIESGSDYGQ